MIKSRFHPIQLYVSLLLTFAVFLILGSLLISLAASEYVQEGSKVLVVLYPALGAMLIALGFYVLLAFLRSVPTIEIDEGKISFSIMGWKKSYYLRDLQAIEYDKKLPFPLIPMFYKPGATFIFENGEVHHMYEEFYSNSWQIKCWIEDVWEKKGPLRDYKDQRLEDKFIGDLQHLPHSGLNSLYGYLFLFTLVFIPLISLFATNIEGFYTRLAWMTLPPLLNFFIYSQLSAHFFLSDTSFVVRKWPFPKNHEVFALADIEEMWVERKDINLPKTLRLITKSHQEFIFYASGMGIKDWEELRNILKERGIKVRIETKAFR